MKKINILAFSLIAVIILFNNSCTNNNSSKNGSPKTINIAGIYPLTGPAASFGNWTKNGVELAIEEANSNNVLKGIQLNHIIEDTKTDNKLAINALEKSISLYKVNAAIGFVSSGEALACAPIAERNKTVMITPVAGSEKIKEAGDFIFRTREDGSLQAIAIADYANQTLGYKKAIILYENAANAFSYRDAFRQQFNSLGGQIIEEIPYDGGTINFKTILTKIKSLNPECVYAPGISTVIGLILKQSKEIGLKTQWLSSAGIEDPKLFELASDAANGVYYAASFFSVDSESEQTNKFVKSYFNKYGENPTVYAANAYDAVNILIECFNKNKYSGKELVDELYKIKNFNGASGSITFDKFGEVYKPTSIKYINENKFNLISK